MTRSDISFRNYISGYFTFLKTNISLLVLTTLSALFIYSIKIFSYNIGMDTELALGYGYTNWNGIGRYALIILQKILCINYLNLFRENFFATLFLILTALNWSWFLKFLKNENISKIALIIFCLAYTSSGIWVEQFYFSLQSAEVSFFLFLIPFFIIMNFDAFLNKKMILSILSIFFIAFSASIYQSIIIFYGGAMLIAFLLIEDKINLKIKDGLLLVLYLIAGAVLYFILIKIINKILCIKESGYLWGMMKPDRSWFLNILKYIYMLCFANNTFLSSIFDGFMAKIARTGNQAVIEMHRQAYALSNTVLLPTLLLYFILIIKNKNLSSLKKILLLITPFTVLIFPAICGGICLNRTQFIVPLITAFIYFTVISELKGKAQIIIFCILIYCTYIQMQRSSALLYSDQIRFESDYELAKNIRKELEKFDIQNKKVLLYGRYTPSYPEGFVYGEDIGKSMFNCDSRHDQTNATRRGIGFIKAVGYNCKPVSEFTENLTKAREYALKMPSYPYNEYVQEFEDIIIVKLSDDN